MSGYINSTSSNIVFITGNQTISGVKTFVENATFGDTGQGDFLVISGNNFTVYGSGNFISGLFVNGNAVLTGINLSSYATVTNLASTGSTLDTKINNLSGYVTGAHATFASITNLGNTGSNLDTKINNLSGYINSSNSNIVFTTGDQTIDGTKTFSSNSYFTNDINIAQNLRVTGSSFFSNNLSVTGNLNVSGNINNSTLVLTKGKQTISGEKTFVDNMSLNAFTGNGYDTSNLDFRLNIGGNTGENVGIQIDAYGINPPQILMRRARGLPTNLSGVLKNDVLFNLQARGYVSGLNDYSTNSRAAIRLIAAEDWVGRPNYTGQGTNILFRTTNIGTGLAMDKVIINTSGLNVLDGNIYISGNQVLTGVDLSNYYTKNNPSGFITGVDLSSYLTSTNASNTYVTKSNGQFTNRPTVNGTGVLLSGEAASLPDTIVYTTGNQIISGNKTFINNIQVSGTGIFNNFNLNEIDILNLSGISVNITGSVSLNTRPTVNGSGVLLIGEAASSVISSNNFFVLSFDHTSDQPTSGGGHNYFAAGNLGFNSAGANRRYIQVLETGTARKATWQHIAGTSLPSPALNSTGYFINVTTNTLGVISTSILSNNTNIPNNFSGLINPPVPLNMGDYVVCSLYTPVFTINPSGLRDTVRVYCY